MANSYIDPSLVRMTLPEGPGWEWNPGQTFVTAFNNAQENKRANEKMAMEQELAAILLPAKAAEAEYNIKKLQLDSEFLTTFHKARTAALPGAYRGVNQAVSGSGGDVVSQDQQPQQQLGYSNRLRKTGTGTLGSGLQPIQPVGGN